MSEINNYVIKEGILEKYTGKDCNIEIPEGVTQIGWFAFANCSSLQNVILPIGLTDIKGRAFEDCCNLKSITFPEGLKSIGDDAFKNCNNMESAIFSKGITTIGAYAFEGCSKLKSITFFDGLISIGMFAFNDCKSLTSVTIPDSIQSIGSFAFFGCPVLREKDGMAMLDNCLIEANESFSDIVVPDGTKLIADCAFWRRDQLKNITIPDSLIYIGVDAFKECSSLTSITLPKSVNCISECTFSGCTSLTDVTIPNGVTSIGHKAFEECSSLKSVTIPESVKSIGDNIFKGCNHLEEVNIPVSVLVNMKELPVELMKSNNLSSATNEQVAYIYLNRRSNSWRQWLREKYLAKDPKGVFSCLYATFEAANKVNKTEALLMSEFIGRYNNALPDEDVRKIMELMEQKKCPVLAQLREMPWIKCHLADGNQPMQEHPIEAFVKARYGKLNPDPRIDEAVKKGIHYNESSIICSRNVLVFIIARYAKKMRFSKNGMPEMKYDQKIPFDQDADYVAAALDHKELSDLLTRLVNGSYGLFLLAWARYAEGKRVNELMAWHVTMKKGKAKLDSRGFNFYEALLLNDTVEAARMYDKYGDLERYAQRRNVTAAELRDSILLPDFGFDADGMKRYDIGGNTIEVSIAPDLSFQLFDVNKQKNIRSFPKQSNDSTKAEACAKEFASFKKDTLAFAKARTELLHKMHMSGDFVPVDLWRKVYVEHPVISKLAQLVVWQDETGKTFMIKDDGIIDSQNNVCEPQGKIRVAHVLDMKPADIASWQQWLVKRGCVQLFEQVWEPVISWNQDDLYDRYNGVTLIRSERDAVKKALKVRGVNMYADEWETKFEHDWDHDRIYFAGYGSRNDMLFGDSLKISYTVDEETKTTTFNQTEITSNSKPREINAILLEMDKATLNAQITRDNDAVLTDCALSVFSVAQVSSLLNLAIDNKATRCIACLLEYKNAHFPEFADVNEFSLDW